MSIEFHLCSTRDEQPVGTAQEVHELIDRYFPGTRWKREGNAESATDHGMVVFSFVGESVDYVNIQVVSPAGNEIFLTLIAMGRDRKCVVIDDGSGEPIDVHFKRSARRIQEIQKEAVAGKKVPTTTRSLKPRLPRITSQESLVELIEDSEIRPNELTLMSLKDHETSYDIFDDVIPVVYPNADAPDLDWFPMTCNQEIRLPDGRRLCVLTYRDPKEVKAGAPVMLAYLQRTGRLSAKIQRKTVILDDESRFRISDCVVVFRAPGGGRMV